FPEQHFALGEVHFLAVAHEGDQLVVGEPVEDERAPQVVDVHQIVARQRGRRYTYIAPSPTADATRFIDSSRTSPAENTPGMLVSRGIGARARLHGGAQTTTSAPRR